MEYTFDDFSKIADNYNHLQKIEKRKTMLFMTLVFFITLLFSSIFLLIGVYVDSDVMEGFYITLIFPGIALIVLVLLQFLYLSSKPLYDYIYRLAIDQINAEDGLGIKITIPIKEKDFILDGGLFPLGSTRYTRYKLDLIDSFGCEVEIRDVTIATQANKTRIIHIDGLYYILKVNPEEQFQIRKKGKPAFKKGTLLKVDDEEEFSLYTKSGLMVSQKYVELYEKLSIEGMQVNISGINGAIHVGLHGYFNFRSMRTIDKIRFEGLKEYIRRLIKIAEKIHEIIYY